MTKLLILVQTTFNLEKFNLYVEKTKENLYGSNIQLEIKNTICNATKIRKLETDEISKKVQYMIIIGGKNSSNVKKLYDISKKNCNNSILVENKNELNQIKGFSRIGIMTGASTPKECIDELVDYLKFC